MPLLPPCKAADVLECLSFVTGEPAGSFTTDKWLHIVPGLSHCSAAGERVKLEPWSPPSKGHWLRPADDRHLREGHGAPVASPSSGRSGAQASFCALWKPSETGWRWRGAVVHDDLTRDRSVYGHWCEAARGLAEVPRRVSPVPSPWSLFRLSALNLGGLS